jgi:hypothetical protein
MREVNKNLEEIKNSRLKTEHLILIWFLILPITSSFIVIIALCLGYWHLIIAYFIYIYFDYKFSAEGKSPKKYQNEYLSSIVRDYFDMKIIKTCDIPANKNYIFAYHPHGIIPYGFFYGLNSNCCGFSSLFPGINLNLKCNSFNLVYPFMREFYLFLGGKAASRESILGTLNEPNNSVLLNIGGGAEIIYAQPNTAKLIIKNRYGFVKIALETGYSNKIYMI